MYLETFWVVGPVLRPRFDGNENAFRLLFDRYRNQVFTFGFKF